MKDKLQELIDRAYAIEDKYAGDSIDVFDAYCKLSGILVDMCKLLQEQVKKDDNKRRN